MATLKKKSPSRRPDLVENEKAVQSARSMSELTETNEYTQDLPKGIVDPYAYIRGAFLYVQSMGEGGSHVDKKKLQKILENLNQEPINEVCEQMEILEKTRTIIRGDIHKLLKRKRSPSPHSTSIKDAEQQKDVNPQKKKQMVPENFIDNAWRYVQSIPLRGDLEGDEEAKLNKILENMEVDRMKFACEEGKPLHPKCNAIHNKIRDLLGRWREPKLGGKRTRRSKTMRKTKRSSRKNKK